MMGLQLFDNRFRLSENLFPACLIAGLITRIVLLFYIPITYTEWFMPFLEVWYSGAWIDPWSEHLNSAGTVLAFPYGVPYLVVFGPLTGLGHAIAGEFGAALGFGFTVLTLDLLLAALIGLTSNTNWRAIAVLAYWLNPVTIYVNYFHGQLDVLPIGLVLASIYLISQHKYFASGLILGFAVSGKFAMALAVPFVIIYLIKELRFTPKLPTYTLGFFSGLIPSILLLFSNGFQTMVLGTPETHKLLAFSLSPFPQIEIYLLPLIIAGLILTAWWVGRQNHRMLLALIGSAFFTIYLFTPASAGWSLWLVPFIALLSIKHGATTQAVGLLFATTLVLFHLGGASGIAFSYLPIYSFEPFASLLSTPYIRSILASLFTASGGLLMIQILRKDVFNSSFFRATRKPFAIGIAGDSGSGKDTLANSITQLFGKETVAHLSGDDYHMWDRHNPMWLMQTHLNPRANYLGQFYSDLKSLMRGKQIIKRYYDHQNGRMTRPEIYRSNHMVVGSGLHAIGNKQLNTIFDLSVYLAMDEQLRRALKISRDVLKRGHDLEDVLRSIEKRTNDYDRYVKSQLNNADIVFSVKTYHQNEVNAVISGEFPKISDIDFVLSVGMKEKEYLSELQAELLTVVGIRIIPLELDDDGFHWIELEASNSARTTQFAAERLVPEMMEFLSPDRKWLQGVKGIMQIIVLKHLIRARNLQKFSDGEAHFDEK